MAKIPDRGIELLRRENRPIPPSARCLKPLPTHLEKKEKKIKQIQRAQDALRRWQQ